MNSKKLIQALTLPVLIGTAWLDVSAQDGSTAYNFLNTTSSARIYGLGGINITNVDDDIYTTDQNPALLGGEMSGQLGINYMRYLGDSNFAGL